jgi:4-aminobutyrate aminotransferase-like enzyme
MIARLSYTGRASMSTSETVANHRQYLFPAVTTYYEQPIALDRGQGSYVWDEEGNKSLDCFGGVLTVSIGHANPKVVAAIVEQVKKISHTSTLYGSKPQSDLAKKLADISPGKLSKTFFTNSGTEANETAVAAAKAATGRNELVVLRHSYSGRSATALTMCGNKNWRTMPAQVPGIVHAHAPYCYRCPFNLE